MMRCRHGQWIGLLCAVGTTLSSPAEAPVKFDEIFSLVKSNVVGVSEADLSNAAAMGLIEKLQGKVELVEPGANTNTSADLIAKTNFFDNAFAYVRVEKVANGLGQKIADAVKNAKSAKGVVLDLRFAKGDDYTAAVDAVNAFLKSEQDILKVGEHLQKSQPRSDAIELPVTVLINRQTRGAAEALAAALKEQQIGLLIGGRTAGQALVFDDFPLTGGQHLRIARTRVALASGKELGTEGVTPDIALDVDEKNERRWLEDPYASILKASSASGPAPFLTSVTNRLNRRLNSAEVARRHREELEEGGLEPEPRKPEPVPQVVQDAALARALDFLKGVTATPRLRGAAGKI
jgi:hypothetical protein